jgi:hypothetical protein
MDEIKDITAENEFVKVDEKNIEQTISTKIIYNKDILNNELNELVNIIAKYKLRIREINELLKKF